MITFPTKLDAHTGHLPFITFVLYGVMDIVPLLISQYVIKLLIARYGHPFLCMGWSG